MKIKFVQNIIDKIRQKDVFEEVSAKQGVNIILQKELLDCSNKSAELDLRMEAVRKQIESFR